MQMNVLLVDDDPSFCELVTDSLFRAGYVVRAVGSAEEALDVLAGTTPDLLLVDLNLPGASGAELLRRVAGAEALPMAHVVVVSAEALRHATPARWCMTKPLDLDLLRTVVRDLVGPPPRASADEELAISPMWLTTS